MKAPSLPKILLIALSTVILLTLPSCVDPGYGYYGSTGYSVLPYGYSTVHVSGVPYYYYGNSWYRRSSGRYIRCARPHGYHGIIGRHSSHHRGITHLPRGYRSHNIGGSRYYSHGNTWYRRSGNIYHVTPRPHLKKTPSQYHSSPSYRSGPSYRHSPSTHSGSSYRSNSSHRSSSSYQPRSSSKWNSYRPSSTHHSSRHQNLTRGHTRQSVTPTHSPRTSTYTPRTSKHRTATPRSHRSTSKPQATPRHSKKAHPLSKPVKTR